MKHKIPFFFLFSLVALHVQAQSYFYNDEFYDNPVIFEAGISLGAINSLTDVGGRKGLGKAGVKDLNINSTNISGGFYLGAIYNHFVGLRIEGMLGRAKSQDSLLKEVKLTAIGRYNRNLSFRTPISEVSLLAEFHPVDFARTADPYSTAPLFSPYIIGGIGYYHFNPQASLNGQWIDLQPLHTEGEGFAEYPESKEYDLNQTNLIYGVGLSYEISSKVNLRIEYLSRKLNTDYLDDVHGKYIDPLIFSKYLVGNDLTNALLLNNRGRPEAKPNETTAKSGSRRGNPTDNDSYFTVNIKVGIIFGRSRISDADKRANRGMRNPTRF